MPGTPLDAAEIATALRGLPGWRADGDGLHREVELPGFPAAITAVDRIAVIAEEMDHHPDIDIRWRTLRLGCFTHSANAVTQRDVELAGRIEAVLAELVGSNR